MSVQHELSIREMPAAVAAFVDEANAPDEPLRLMEDGAVRAVVLSYDAYAALMERLEDLADSLSVLEARASGEPTRSFDDYLREHAARDALVPD